MKRVGGLFLYAILAGFCIGLGGTVFLKLNKKFKPFYFSVFVALIICAV